MIDLILNIEKYSGRLYGQINLEGDSVILDSADTELKLIAKIKKQLEIYERLNENDYTIRKDYIN